jgi:hypothetical protein
MLRLLWFNYNKVDGPGLGWCPFMHFLQEEQNVTRAFPIGSILMKLKIHAPFG